MIYNNMILMDKMPKEKKIIVNVQFYTNTNSIKHGRNKYCSKECA